jgi:HpcH/HpaI aldolase/citrate lyase family
MNTYEKQMLAILQEGKDRYGIVAVKAEFEAEGTRVDELLRLLEIARRAGVKVGLKIGGCEAIRDLIECRQYGVDYVIAPMVETPYALSKYIAAIAKVFPDDERKDIGFLFNLETRTTFDSLVEMARIGGEENVGLVFGRVDFAGSLGRDRAFVNSPKMMSYVRRAAEVARERNIELVVGGGVSQDSIEPLRGIRNIRLDRFETRKVIFDSEILIGDKIARALTLAIEFELLWLKNKRDYYLGIGAEDESRIAMMEARQHVKAVAAA